METLRRKVRTDWSDEQRLTYCFCVQPGGSFVMLQSIFSITLLFLRFGWGESDGKKTGLGWHKFWDNPQSKSSYYLSSFSSFFSGSSTSIFSSVSTQSEVTVLSSHPASFAMLVFRHLTSSPRCTGVGSPGKVQDFLLTYTGYTLFELRCLNSINLRLANGLFSLCQKGTQQAVSFTWWWDWKVCNTS